MYFRKRKTKFRKFQREKIGLQIEDRSEKTIREKQTEAKHKKKMNQLILQ